MSISVDTFRAALRQMASGVTIVTVHSGGEDHGFTASSFTGVSLEPMLVLVCVMNSQRTHVLIEEAGHFAVNILGTAQKDLGLRFSLPDSLDRFTGIPVARAETGAAILAGSLAWVDCRLHAVHPGGDHKIFVGEVVAGEAPGSQGPLVYYNRAWGTFTDT